MAFLEDIRDYDYLPYLLHSCPFFDLLEKYIAERNPAMPLRGSVKKFKHSLSHFSSILKWLLVQSTKNF